jgi:hypothetical protein
MQLRLFGLAVFLNLLVCIASDAQESSKFALIVGNKSYTSQVGPLSNPLNDAKLVSDALVDIGFRVEVVRDGDRVTILRKVSEFAKALGRAGPGAIGFFYYSGHGVSRPESQVNYLIPVDVHDINDPNIWWNAVPLDAVIDELQRNAPDAARFLVFDACRNELRVASRGVTSKSFVPIFAQGGTFIATSTGPNSTATDNPGQTSGPYARALALELRKPGLDHSTLFQNVKRHVFATTTPPQRGWETSGLIDPVYFNSYPPSRPTQPATLTTPTVPPAKSQAPEQQASNHGEGWMPIKGVNEFEFAKGAAILGPVITSIHVPIEDHNPHPAIERCASICRSNSRLCQAFDVSVVHQACSLYRGVDRISSTSGYYSGRLKK